VSGLAAKLLRPFGHRILSAALRRLRFGVAHLERYLKFSLTDEKRMRSHPHRDRKSGPGRALHSVLVVLFSLILGGGWNGALAQSAYHPGFPRNAELEEMLDYLVEDGVTAGITLGILEADGSTRIVSRGSAGPQARPLGPQSRFELGSINKTFTGVLLAQMVSAGEVALEDPVATYLPDSVRVPSWEGSEITLLDLATHTSGLPSVPANYTPVDPGNPWAHYTLEHLYDFLSNYELRRAPGQVAEYSNIGVGLLGHALSRAAGQDFRSLLTDRLLEPLGMENTGFTHDDPTTGWMAQGYRSGEVVPFWTGTEAIDGAGGLLSNAMDMLRFLDANVGEPTTELERAMRDAHQVRREFTGGRDIGLGWWTYYYDGRSYLEHGGSTGGFRTYIGIDPSNGIGFVLLTNTGDFADDIGRDFLHYGKPIDVAVVDVPLETLESYTGQYAYREDRSLFIRLEEERFLTAQTPGNARVRLYPESQTAFVAKRQPWRITFSLSEAGEPVGLSSEYLGTINQGPKTADAMPSPREVARGGDNATGGA